jgi:hypothetical protein
MKGWGTTAPGPGGGRKHGPTRVALSTIAPRAIEWLWQGRIPLGAVSSFDGMPGAGKSTLLAHLVACVTTGRPLPFDERPSEPKAALWIGHEEGAATAIRPRLDSAGADATKVSLYDRMPSFPADYEWLAREITETNAAIVVVDPIDAYLDFGSNGDSHRNGDVRVRLAGLAKIANDTGAAVIMVRHWRKSGGTDPMYRAAGSLAYSALARSIASVARDPDDPSTRLVFWSKVSGGADPETLRFTLEESGISARVRWLGHDSRRADEIMRSTDARASGRAGTSDAKASAIDAAADWLMCELQQDGRVRVDALRVAAQADGIAWRTIERAKARLKVRAIHAGEAGIQGGGVWWWCAPGRRPSLQGQTANEDGDTAKHRFLAGSTSDLDGPASKSASNKRLEQSHNTATVNTANPRLAVSTGGEVPSESDEDAEIIPAVEGVG